MPAHTSHLLQPLDVGCFSPLKTAYRREVTELARLSVYHVDKEEFLSVYPRIRRTVFTEQNIKAGFQATGLVPPCPDRVLSCLPVVRTPSPLQTEPVWTAETPHTTTQAEQQAQLIRDRLQRLSQSPTHELLRQLVKGCQLAMNSATLLAEENRRLRDANQRRRQRQDRRRAYIASGGALQAEEGQRLAAEAERVLQQVEQTERTGRSRAPPTCSNCHIQGHTRTQCRQRL